MRVAICDDDRYFITFFRGLMNRMYNSLDIITEDFCCGDDLLKGFKHKAYDVVFLDIEMPDMDGITLAKKLREISSDVYIVFLTGHTEYAINGYEVNALRYLTKPAEENKLREVIDHVLSKQEGENVIWVKTEDGRQKIMLSDILYIEAQNRNVIITTNKDSFTVRGNISDYEEQLCKRGFYRVHRGYLISLGKVLRISSNKTAVMEDGAELPISRSKEAALKEILN